MSYNLPCKEALFSVTGHILTQDYFSRRLRWWNFL